MALCLLINVYVCVFNRVNVTEIHRFFIAHNFSLMNECDWVGFFCELELIYARSMFFSLVIFFHIFFWFWRNKTSWFFHKLILVPGGDNELFARVWFILLRLILCYSLHIFFSKKRLVLSEPDKLRDFFLWLRKKQIDHRNSFQNI